MDFLKVLLQVAECLAWALPSPFGAVGAGSLTFIDALFMGGGGGSHGVTRSDVEALLEQAVDDMKSYINEILTDRDREDVAAFTSWFTTERSVFEKIGDDVPYLENALMTVDRMTTPGAGSLLNALQHIEGAYDRFDPDDLESFKEQISLFQTLMAAMSAVMFATRMKLLMSSRLTSLYEERGMAQQAERMSGLWLGYYAELIVLMNGTDDDTRAMLASHGIDHATKLTASGGGTEHAGLPDKAQAYLKSLQDSIDDTSDKGLLYRAAEKGKIYPANVGLPGVGSFRLEDEGVTWKHVMNRSECLEFYKGVPSFGMTGCGPEPWTFLKELFPIFQPVADIVAKWRGAASAWYNNSPPLTPKKSVEVHDPWGASTPQQPNWVSHNAVSYAVVYENEKGRSPKGPFCDWVEIVDKAFPTVAVPADPLAMATKIRVYRRFRTDPEKSLLIKELVGDHLEFQDAKA